VGKLGKFAARSGRWQPRIYPRPQWPRPDGEGQGCCPGTLSREPRTYTLAVVVEPAEGVWHAYCPTLLDYGAATWGVTREEVLERIRQVAGMILERLVEAKMPVLPPLPEDSTPVSGSPKKLPVVYGAAPAELVPTPTEQVVVTVCAPTR
jgi:predicted RNase H-like HicB family nuclease